MFYILKVDSDVKELDVALKELENAPDRLDGTLELIYEMMDNKECGSYKNNRIMWLGWQLEEKGIHVIWSLED